METVKEYMMDKREDGTISGMRAIDGYYLSRNVARADDVCNISRGLVRQINVYDVKTDEEAVVRARADGLITPLMLEVFVGEPQPCVLFKKPTIKEMQEGLKFLKGLDGDTQ